jgi:hypothetical protein
LTASGRWRTAAEPSALNQFKAYMTFFEEDNSDAADIDLEMWTHNCTGSEASNRLRSDASFDVKSMVRENDSNVAGQELCTKVRTYHVPSGQTRRVQLVMYYSRARHSDEFQGWRLAGLIAVVDAKNSGMGFH